MPTPTTLPKACHLFLLILKQVCGRHSEVFGGNSDLLLRSLSVFLEVS